MLSAIRVVSVQSTLRRQLDLAADRRSVQPSEHGIAEMMIDVFGTYAHPFDDATVSLAYADAVTIAD